MNKGGEQVLSSRGYIPMILHVDGDNFFVSCEVARMAHLYGKPVVVGAERGIATALNVQAKSLGIKRGDPVFKIKKEFPDVTILPAHFELYEKYSDNLFSILTNYIPSTSSGTGLIKIHSIERYSIDECFGLVFVKQEFAQDKLFLEKFLEDLKCEVNTSLGVTYSFGLAPTKTLAKVASKLNKPNGFAVIRQSDSKNEISGELATILKQVPVKSIWGIGWALSTRLIKMNIKTASDFISFDPNYLIKHFAAPVYDTWAELRGIMRLENNQKHQDYKSMQSTQCFELNDFKESEHIPFIESEVSRHCEIISGRMRMRNYSAHQFGISIRFKYQGSLSSRSGRFTTRSLTNNPALIIEAAQIELAGLLKQVPIGARVRATGIGAAIVREKDIREDLFGSHKQEQEINEQAKIIDTVNKKFRAHTIMNASSLLSFRSRDLSSTVRNTTNHYMYDLPLPYMGETT